MKTNASICLASLAGVLLTAAPAHAVDVLVIDSVVPLVTSGKKYYTFQDPASGESVIVRVTMNPVSKPAPEPFDVVALGTDVAIGMPGTPDADTIDASEGVDFSASLVFASTGVRAGTVGFRIGGLGLVGVPTASLQWGSSATPGWKPLTVTGGTTPYALDAPPAVPLSPGVTYSAHLRPAAMGAAAGFYRLSDAAPVTGESLVMHAEFDTVAADPHANSWMTQDALRYARIYPDKKAKDDEAPVTTWLSVPSGLEQAFPAYSGVQQIHSTADDIYVLTTGLGHEVMGPWNGGAFPNFPINQKSLWRFPRAPVVMDTKTYTPVTGIGYLVDGVALFDPWSAEYYDYNAAKGINEDVRTATGAPGGYWNCNAYVTEAIGFDRGLAHPQRDGIYHNHVNPLATRYLLSDHVDYDPATRLYSESTTIPTNHSPIIGWMNDGFPLYGPYGYSKPLDPTSGIRHMVSGFQLRSDITPATGRAGRPLWEQRLFTPAVGLPTGPSLDPAKPDYRELGYYIEDYEYKGDRGLKLGADFDLDQFNGRWCVTPEFPMGTYAYFVTIDDNGEPVFPYIIGRAFCGDPTGGEPTALPAGATTLFDSMADLQPMLEKPVFTRGGGGPPTVTLTWTDAIEGGQYQVQASHDLKTWTALGGLVTATDTRADTTLPVPAPDHQMYRLELNEVNHFDAAKGPPTQGTPNPLDGVTMVSPDSMVAGPIITLDIGLGAAAPAAGWPNAEIVNATSGEKHTITISGRTVSTVTGTLDLHGVTPGTYNVVLDFGGPKPLRRDGGFIVR